ncbi:MAG: T9SS type A sorting domain-containing protein [Balneolia bacterium]|nr:T9SS type A sorting domain-containing protein [Balneolia bacterium]
MNISNNGNSTLTYEIFNTQTQTVLHSGFSSDQQLNVGNISSGSSADLLSATEGTPPRTSIAFMPHNTFDCEGAEGLIIQDNGEIDNGYSGNPNLVDEVIVAESFSIQDPSSFGTICISLLSLGSESLDFELVIYSADESTGAPDEELFSVWATAEDLPDGLPDEPAWYTVDLSGAALLAEPGTYIIGARFQPQDPNVFVAADESSDEQGNGWFYTDDADEWVPLTTQFPDYKNLLIRPQLTEPLACMSPEEVSWISVADDSGDVAPGETEQALVTLDSSGLTEGTYEALLCVLSNDPEAGLTEVPVTMEVLPDPPVAEVNPEELNPAAEEGSQTTETITISNSGIGELEWTAGTTSETRYGTSAPGFQEYNTSSMQQPLSSFDCDEADGLIILDAGIIDNGYSGNPAMIDEVTITESFSPEDGGVLGTVCLSFMSQGPESLDFELVVYQDNPNADGPGVEIASVQATAEDLPEAETGIEAEYWVTADLSGLNIIVEDGERVYIGAKWSPPSPNVFLAADESSSVTGEGYIDLDDGWQPIQNQFTEYKAMMIRPQFMDLSGCFDPEGTDWISLSATDGIIASGQETEITATFDSENLSPGTYEAQVCFLTNDPDNSVVAIPVSFTVEEVPDLAEVWPGDTNNDGVVSLSDVLTIGAFWGEEGPARDDDGTSWEPNEAEFWENEPAATWADANGDGVIDDDDLSIIVQHQGNTQPDYEPSDEAPISESNLPSAEPGSIITATLTQVPDDILGAAFYFTIDGGNSPEWTIHSFEAGDWAQEWITDDMLLSLDYIDGSDFGIVWAHKGEAAPSQAQNLVTVEIEAGEGWNGDLNLLVNQVNVLDENLEQASLSGVIVDITVEDPVDTPTDTELPQVTKLNQNYPNPFNPTTNVQFDLASQAEVVLEVYNVLGQHVSTLISGEMMQAGSHSVTFDGSRLNSGVYFIRMQAGSEQFTKSMTLVK